MQNKALSFIETRHRKKYKIYVFHQTSPYLKTHKKHVVQKYILGFFLLIQASFKIYLDKQEQSSQNCSMFCELYDVILYIMQERKLIFRGKTYWVDGSYAYISMTMQPAFKHLNTSFCSIGTKCYSGLDRGF